MRSRRSLAANLPAPTTFNLALTMADPVPTPTPTPTPPPTPTPTPRGRSGINQAWLSELSDSERIAAAAQKESHQAQLASGDIDDAKVTALVAALAAARKLAAQAVQGTTGKHIVTDEEAGLQETLINRIQYIQKRARQKYDATDPGQLADYAVGQKFYSSRTVLEQTAANILLKLSGDQDTPADKLPGVDAAKIAALQQALAGFQGAQSDQSGAQSGATTARRQLEAAIADIVSKRREIQFAADAEWPHTDSANAGIRAEFQLPPDRVVK